MYIIIDNYDSFTYNLYQYLCELTDKPVEVIRNDAIDSPADLEAKQPEGIIISPGPGRPEDGGLSIAIIRHFAGKVPILGVCLGLQAIAVAFGAVVDQAQRIVHGKVENIQVDDRGLFRNIPSPARFTRYHSLAVMRPTIPAGFEVTAVAPDGEIMGIRHKQYTIEGVQFHPESMASEYGKRLLKNFLDYKREPFRLKEMLTTLTAGRDLTFAEAQSFMEELTGGNLTNAQIAAFIVAITIKGPAPDEIAGCASVLRKKRTPITVGKPALDTCGTGGDGLGTFNISSLSALLAASCGAWVAKHGNRAASSLCGSADFYKELGININLSPARSEQLFAKTGFAFLFAPLYHQAMKYAGPVRQEIKVKTIMNLVGPLSNPANASYQLIGVYDEALCLPVARAAKILGVERVMVVYGFDGMDEISVTAKTRVVEIDGDGTENEYIFDPTELGLPLYNMDELKGGDAKANVQMARDILAGKGKPALRDAVLLNTGAALYVAGIADSIREGYSIAKTGLGNGSAANKLSQVVQESNSV